MTRFEERAFVPAANGGSTFNGLVARLLGTSPDRETEGTQVRRFIYHVYTGDRKIGVVHGSTVGFEGRDLQVFVAYDLSGKLLDVRAAGLAQADLARLAPALEQFRGTDVADFEVIRGRKGRITSQGSFLTSAKRPTDARTRAIFERVVRAVRFNAAFMDVAVFIKEHPDLADDNRIALSEPVSGPEAFIRSREVATSNDPTVNPTERSSRSSRP